MRFILAIILTLVLMSTVNAHEWYPMNCCYGTTVGGDCHPVLCDEIIETAKGAVYHGVEFLKEQIHPSLDRFCHACISNEGYPNAVSHCLFIQQGS